MKNIYNVLIVALIFCAFNVTHAQSKIMRASISSSVNNANNTHNNFEYTFKHNDVPFAFRMERVHRFNG